MGCCFFVMGRSLEPERAVSARGTELQPLPVAEEGGSSVPQRSKKRAWRKREVFFVHRKADQIPHALLLEQYQPLRSARRRFITSFFLPYSS